MTLGEFQVLSKHVPRIRAEKMKTLVEVFHCSKPRELHNELESKTRPKLIVDEFAVRANWAAFRKALSKRGQGK